MSGELSGGVKLRTCLSVPVPPERRVLYHINASPVFFFISEPSVSDEGLWGKCRASSGVLERHWAGCAGEQHETSWSHGQEAGASQATGTIVKIPSSSELRPWKQSCSSAAITQMSECEPDFFSHLHFHASPVRPASHRQYAVCLGVCVKYDVKYHNISL